MEYKIGEIVALPPYGIKARVEEGNTADCNGCYYHYNIHLCDYYWMNGVLGDCMEHRRKDHKNIIYKPLSEE